MSHYRREERVWLAFLHRTMAAIIYSVFVAEIQYSVTLWFISFKLAEDVTVSEKERIVSSVLVDQVPSCASGLHI